MLLEYDLRYYTEYANVLDKRQSFDSNCVRMKFSRVKYILSLF